MAAILLKFETGISFSQIDERAHDYRKRQGMAQKPGLFTPIATSISASSGNNKDFPQSPRHAASSPSVSERSMTAVVPRRLFKPAAVTSLVVLMFALSATTYAMDEQELSTLLEKERIELRMPGLRAAVMYPDGRLVRAAVGLANKEAGLPLDDTVGMPGGSTGKTFVAALTMLLVEDGVLSLDDPASKWLGGTDWYHKLPNAEEIQVRHLLSHSSGIADYPGKKSFLIKMVWRVLRKGSAYFEPEELIGFVLKKKPSFPPGQGFKYTDAGYLVLGLLIEAATGEAYYDLLQERILKPQQLSQVRPARTSVLPDITPGYTGGARNLKKDGRMKFDPRSEWTGGGLVTNPTMLVQFYAALAAGHIVEPGSFEAMLNAGWRDPEGSGYHYGYGLFVADDATWFGHGGMWPGYRSHVTHYAETGVTIAVQTNRDGRLDMRALVIRIASLVDSA
jgi:D-alanyl-D-alanine carboxypeptidase